MQISLASDFERFSQHINEQTHIHTQKHKDKALSYALEKKETASNEIDIWIKTEQSAWKKEYQERQRQAYIKIQNDINTQWSTFKKEREKVLRKQIEEKIEEVFPNLVETFINWVCANYSKGTFILPREYISFIRKDKFIVSESNQEGVIFKDQNLYIEYSVKRIIDELNEDIASALNFEGNEWQI